MTIGPKLYDIDVSSIHEVEKDSNVQLLLTYSEGQAVATALLHKTADIIGVHLVGVPDRYRGKGIASILMQHVIKACNAWDGRYITLQSSAAGESIYRRLGFKEQFVIRSYQRAF